MLTIHPVSAGTGIDYLLSTVASDDRTLGVKEAAEHWAAGADTPGTWIGRGAVALGLTGEVSREHADSLFKYGEDPHTGENLGRRWRQYKTVEQRYAERLAQEPKASAARKQSLREQVEREGERAARAGWEMVVAPVKSFGIALALADDEGQEKLLQVEERAFRKMWERIESDAAYARIGANGVAQIPTDGLTAAIFTHRSSRAGDPAFHRHIAISSKVFADGKWLALDARPLHRQRVTFGEVYAAELERGMAEVLGITAEEREDSLSFDKRPVREFRGIGKELISEFSTRRKQTEGHLRALMGEFRLREGREPNRAEAYQLAQAAALTQRPDKELRSPEEERAHWRERARKHGLRAPEKVLETGRQESLRAERRAPRTPEEHALEARKVERLEDIPAAAIRVLERQRETWTRPNAEAEVVRQLVGSGWHITLGGQFEEAVQQLTTAVLSPEHCELVDMPDLLPVPTAYRRADGTSLFHDAGCTRFTSHAITAAERYVVEAAQTPAAVRQLTPEQVSAALDAGHAQRGFTPSEEQLAIVHGAFTGDRRVQAVIGRAGAGKTTIMALIREVGDAYGIPVIGFSNGQVQADVLAEEAGIRTENVRRWLMMSELISPGARQWTLPAGAIVILDEAGQAASTDMADLLRQATRAGGRLLPVGDPLQLGAPGPGGLLAHIEADAGALYLTEVRRFRDHDGKPRTWEIEASKALAEGDSTESFEAYHSRRRIHFGSADAMEAQAYEAWLADTRDGLVSILVAPDNATASALSARARDDRVSAGIVDSTRTIRLHDGNMVGAGDRIATRAIDRRIPVRGGRGYVRNGDIWTVTKVRRDGSLVVRSDQSKARTVLPPSYVERSVELGYAITKDRAQGVTTDTAHALFAPGMTRNAAYPAATRGKYENHIYLVVTPETDPIVGEPDPIQTARQAWDRIVGRDGTTRSATVAQRESLEETGALSTLVPRLRFVLDDLAGDQFIRQFRDEVPMADAIVTSDAWPALRDLLTRIDAGGEDPIAAVRRVLAQRDVADADDVAAVLHWRLHQDTEAVAALQVPEADAGGSHPGARLLDQLRLTVPAADSTEKGIYAAELAQAVTARADYLAVSAVDDAVLGQGWAAAYGPRPDDPEESAAWRARLAAAAAYRDLLQLADRSPLGPAPADGPERLRRLWRDAQIPEDPAAVTARVLSAADEGARWLDALGPLPSADDPRQSAWLAAATAIETYRNRWDYGREDIALGSRPIEPVQAADYDDARAQVDRFHQSTPPRATPTEQDRTELQRAVQRGELGAIQAAQAARAEDTAHTSRREARRAEQEAADAENRAATARDAAAGNGRRTDVQVPEARAAHLTGAAEHARQLAQEARQHAEEAEDRARLHGARSLEARADAREGQDAERALGALDSATAPAAPSWRERPFGILPDRALRGAESSALARARLADTEADEAYARADRLDHDAADGGRIETETAARAERIDAIQTRRQAHLDLTAAVEAGQAARDDLGVLTARLEERGSFGRLALRGAARRDMELRAAQAEDRHAEADRQAREARDLIDRLADLAGPEHEHSLLLEEWQRLGGSADAVVAAEKRIAAGDATAARTQGDRMRRRAEEQRDRAAGLRGERAVRAALPVDLRRAEAAERAGDGRVAHQRQAAESADTAARRQLGDEQNRRDGNRY
ncbi:MobF family relaxase [Streptomyces sp. NPDC000594]|uniref:MobF family relaxase n=1 Tax=Streptomyces sp. NPDC000594 TaxID=3154261 RepID=UPI00331E984E